MFGYTKESLNIFIIFWSFKNKIILAKRYQERLFFETNKKYEKTD
jgi:hypothetical protein